MNLTPGRTRRHPRPLPRRPLVAVAPLVVVVLGAALCLPEASAAAAGPPTTVSAPGDTDSQIATDQAQAAALEAQIATQQQQVTTLSEQYDQAAYDLQQVQAKLDATQAQLLVDRQREAQARRTLQVDAVNAYMYDAPDTRLLSAFASTTATGQLHDVYQATAIGNTTDAADQLAAAGRQLAGAETGLRDQEAQAAADTTSTSEAQNQAQAEAEASTATLDDIKGQMAHLIVEQAAKQAAAEAAAAEAAAAAQDDQARQQAAAAATAAAGVAETLGAGTAAAGAATNSANEAAGGATIGRGSPEEAAGAGAVAVAVAERYLGVPYVWGGASMGGVDCSGLVMLAWKAAGVSLVHSAALQYLQSTPVPLDQVQPGDLLFYDLDGSGIDHVVMFVGLGPYGADTIIQAAHTGTFVEFDPYWLYGLVGAGRP